MGIEHDIDLTAVAVDGGNDVAAARARRDGPIGRIPIDVMMVVTS